jgi:hypothetical protein
MRPCNPDPVFTGATILQLRKSTGIRANPINAWLRALVQALDRCAFLLGILAFSHYKLNTLRLKSRGSGRALPEFGAEQQPLNIFFVPDENQQAHAHARKDYRQGIGKCGEQYRQKRCCAEGG